MNSFATSTVRPGLEVQELNSVASFSIARASRVRKLEYILGKSKGRRPAAFTTAMMVGCDKELWTIPREKGLRGRNGGADNADMQFNGSRKPYWICVPSDVVVILHYLVHVNGPWRMTVMEMEEND